jgi:hypothetical protein
MQMPRQRGLSASRLFSGNDFGDLLGDRRSYLVVVEILQPERDPQRRSHKSPPDLQRHPVGSQQSRGAVIGVTASYLVQKGFHPGKSLLEFFDRKTVERRAHHDARLKFVGGLDFRLRCPGLTQRGRGVGEILQRGRQKLAFAAEVAVQQAVIDAGSGGNLADGCRGWTLFGEQFAGCLQDGGADLVFTNWLRRGCNRCLRCSHLCTVADSVV